MQYSLTDYILTITPKDEKLSALGPIVFGGQGNAAGAVYDSVTFEMTNNIFSTETFAAGGYVHNKNNNSSGTVTISLSQLHPNLAKLKRYARDYGSRFVQGCTITLTDANNANGEVASALDCVPQNMTSQVFGETAGRQSWVFLAGKVNM